MSDGLHYWIFERYLPQNLKVRDPKTRRNYSFALSAFAEFLGREPTRADLNDETFAAFINHLHLTLGLAETTVNGYAAKLWAFWGWAARKHHVDTFPERTRLEVPERIPAAWREDELVKLFNGCRMQRGYVGDVPAWRWWFTIHGWWWCTAERSGATFLLRVEHLRLSEGIAVLPAVIRKGKRKPKVHRLWPDLIEMLRSILPPFTKPRELVFEWDQYRDHTTFYNHYDKMLQSVGLPHDRYRKPHAMRVSHATWLKIMGGDPTKALGHGDPATTRRYIDTTLDRDDEVRLFMPWDRTPPPGT